jgi:hypothetical protein
MLIVGGRYCDDGAVQGTSAGESYSVKMTLVGALTIVVLPHIHTTSGGPKEARSVDCQGRCCFLAGYVDDTRDAQYIITLQRKTALENSILGLNESALLELSRGHTCPMSPARANPSRVKY